LSDRLLSDRLLGHAASFDDFARDYGLMLDAYGPRLPQPRLSLGHSMGGCLVLLALARGETRIAGTIVTAPMCAVLTDPLPRPLARIVARVMTAVGLGGGPIPGRSAEPTPFEDNRLTHDPDRYARNEAFVAACPALALGTPTWGWVDSAFAAARVLAKGPGVKRIAAPVTLLAAGIEVLVDNAVTRAVAERLPRGRYVEIAESYHEILQETDPVRAIFWREFDDLAARVGA
jgi:lysophospholipase